jgi:L-iditol 2-dehydrogenase
MKALVYKGPGVVGIEERPDPRPAPDEVLVAVRAAGICGSDIHGFAGITGRRAPGTVMGHEAAGVIVGLGRDVERPRRGSRVAIFPITACGTCGACLRGEPQICTGRRVLGVHVPGAYAEYMVVPAENCRPLRRTTTFAQGALAEPLAVGLHAVKQSGVARGQAIAILGAGGIGLCALLACRVRGVRLIYVTDVVTERLALAEALGAIPISPRDADPVERIQHEVGPLGSVVDAVGIAETLRQALAMTAPGGRIVMVGMGSPVVDLPLYDLVTQERTLSGAYAYTASDYARAVRLINRRRVDVTPLIGRTCALDDLPDLFPRLWRGEVTAPRVVVGVGAESPRA